MLEKLLLKPSIIDSRMSLSLIEITPGFMIGPPLKIKFLKNPGAVILYRDVNACNRFYYRDYEHSSACMYCQKRMLLYYLGRCMEKLANDGRLPRFDEVWLTRAKIRDRTYEHIKFGSELIFRIDRHRNAWRDETRMEIIIQTWVFDFTDMSLKELSYYAYLIGIPIRRLTESKSEWRGTAAQLHFELKNIAKVLKINTKSNLWPTSSYS
jgi:hypothetical protein